MRPLRLVTLSICILAFCSPRSLAHGIAGDVSREKESGNTEPLTGTGEGTPESPTRVCINLIVKNEAEVIERMLLSVVDHIHCWVICDTGSTDNTPHLITSFFAKAGLKGALLHHKWVDFGHNRNLCLQSALEWSLANAEEGRTHEADYMMFMDADQELIVSNEGANLKTMGLRDDVYYMQDWLGSTIIKVLRLCSTRRDWKWFGAVHEVVGLSDGSTSYYSQTVQGVQFLHNTQRDSPRYARDAEILEREVAKDPTDTRSQFYLANSYKDAHNDSKAIENYVKRIKMGGWIEEVYMSAFYIGFIMNRALDNGKEVPMEAMRHLKSWSSLNLGDSVVHNIIHVFLAAAQLIPSRQEAWYEAAYMHRVHLEEYESCVSYALAANALGPPPDGALFPIQVVYDYYSLEEICICAAYTGDRYLRTGQKACEELRGKLEQARLENLPGQEDLDPSLEGRVDEFLAFYDKILRPKTHKIRIRRKESGGGSSDANPDHVQKDEL